MSATDEANRTQPSLSQQIVRLERELDTALFIRTSRQVRLTAAGAALLLGARRALMETERAAHAAREAATGASGELVLGAVGSALNGVLPRRVRAFIARSPGVAVDVRQLDTAEQLVALQEHRLDAGFIRSAEPLPGLAISTPLSEPLVAVLPAEHPLAARAQVPLMALRSEPFVLWPRQASSRFHDELIAAFRRVGFSPQIRYEARGAETLLALIAAGLGVSVQPEPYRNLARVGVSFRPLADPAPATAVQLATRRGDRSPVLQRFLTVVDDHITGSRPPAE